MSWARLDDAMPHHPKIVAAGALGFALDVAAICYSNRYGLDGFIADSSLPAVLPGLSAPRKVALRLCDVGRWNRDDERGGFIIHDVAEYQFTAEEQDEKRRKRADAGRKGGEVSGAVRRAKAEAKPKHLLRQSFDNVEPRPDPTRPDPSIEVDTSSETHTPSGDTVCPAVAVAIEIEVGRRYDDRVSKGVQVGNRASYLASIRDAVHRECAPAFTRIASGAPGADGSWIIAEYDRRTELGGVA